MFRSRLGSLIQDPVGRDRPVLVDVGTSSLTAVRSAARPDLQVDNVVAHPVMETLALSASDCVALGSDCVRAGFLFNRVSPPAETLIDSFGVEWLRVDSALTPVRHPLEGATLAEIAKYPRPEWPQVVQIPHASHERNIVVADAPCPGLLDLSFVLRNSWTCLEDMTSNWRSISALLDWSLETIIAAYEQMLSALPFDPDILVYGDDLGFQQSMFVSEIDFRNFVRPRMRTLVSRLRRLTSAALCFHSCGAIRPILADICDLGIEIVNFDGGARGMACAELRREVPKHLVFHGCSDLVALGRGARTGNMASVALLVSEIIDSMPAIAAPMDNLHTAVDVEDAQMGAQILHELAPDDIAAVARLGPVRGIVENAVRRAQAAELPKPLGLPPEIIRIPIGSSVYASAPPVRRRGAKPTHSIH